MPPTPQPTMPSPLIIVVCESVPTSVSGKINAVAFKHAFCQILEIHLVNDADARRDDAKSVKRLSSPFQKSISLFVAAKLHLHVSLIGGFAAGVIDLDRMVDHQIDRHERLDDARILPDPLHRRTHRRKVDKQRHARKILQDDPRTTKGISPLRSSPRLPRGKRSDIRFADLLPAIKIPQNRFENDA